MNIAFKAPKPSFRSLDAIAEKLLLPTGIDGVYTRTAAFETVVEALSALICRHREPGTEVLRFPPVALLSSRKGKRSGDCGRSFRSRSRLDAGFVRVGPRAQPRGLLSGLSAGREPRRRARRGPELRCRRRLFPARTVQRH